MHETALSQPRKESKKELQAEAARERILSAVIDCLDRYGYAETSISRIQEAAGFSRGALTHHFPSKEEMMVVAAERLLRPTLSLRRRKHPAGAASEAVLAVDVEADIVWMWEKLVDTSEGRALLEILVASRTDDVLRQRIATKFARWNNAINETLIENYGQSGMDGQALQEFWTICRVFLRGLNTQSQFDPDDGMRKALVRRFAHAFAAQMSRPGD